jgi:hypothetical protein
MFFMIGINYSFLTGFESAKQCRLLAIAIAGLPVFGQAIGISTASVGGY